MQASDLVPHPAHDIAVPALRDGGFDEAGIVIRAVRRGGRRLEGGGIAGWGGAQPGRAAGRVVAHQGRELRAQLIAEQEALERRKRDMEQQLQRLFTDWDTLQDRGDAGAQARAERDRLLKQMRDILSNRTYVKNIVNDLIATIG